MTLFFLLMTHDKKDIQILQIPVYEDIMHEGHILLRRIKEYKYAVVVQHKEWTHQIKKSIDKVV